MPTASENNMFRRLIGDYQTATVSTDIISTWLDDACQEVTADFVNASGTPFPVTDFDLLAQQYKPEVVYKAAINYWWSKAAELSDKLTTQVGTASQQTSDKWDRAMKMITALEEHYQSIQQLGLDITIGNLSYFSKASLTRIGGMEEELKRDLF